MTPRMKALALAFATCAFATPASAAIVDVTYTGTVDSGSDVTGVFTAPGSSLAGFAFTAHYSFDTTIGTTVVSPTQTLLFGGNAYSTTSPSLGASLTINGVTVVYTGNFFAELVGANSASYSQTYHTVVDDRTIGSLYTNANLMNEMFGYPGTGLPADITTAFTATTEGNTPGGLFNILTSDLTDFTVLANASGTLLADTVVVTVTEAPEPTTITLLAAGLLALGAARRKRA